MWYSWRSLYVFCIVFLWGTLAYTVDAQNLPGSADPSRFQERFETPISSSDDYIKGPKKFHMDAIPVAADNGFILQRIHLRGLIAFAQSDLESVINEYIGRRVDLNILNHLAKRITAYYHEHGYFLSKALVPAQEVRDGQVDIQIVEGYVDDVIIEDPTDLLRINQLTTTNNIIAQIKNLDPLHGPTLERYMLLLNEGAGLYVQSIMAAADERNAGAINIILKVSKNPQSFTVGYNNHGSRFVGPHQLHMAYVAGGLFNPYDSYSVQTTISVPMDEIQYSALSYQTPFDASGVRFHASMSYANSEPGESLEALEVEGDSFSLKTGIDYPVIRSRRTNLTVGAALNIRNSATEFLGQELIDDKIRSLSLEASFDTHDQWQGVNTVSASLYKGLDMFDSTETGSSNLSRSQGRSDFVKFEASAARVQKLSKDFTAIGEVKGQYSAHPLLSSAEFGYGGVDFGRAYDPSEITGDEGIAAAVEVRYTGLKPISRNFFLTPFSFYDIGKVWNKDSGSEPLSAASAGFGVYYQIAKTPVTGSLMVAYPLTKSITTPITGGTSGPRILFELNTHF